MFCQKCGNQLNDSAVFCPKCGTKVEAKGEAKASLPSQPVNYQSEQAQQYESIFWSFIWNDYLHIMIFFWIIIFLFRLFFGRTIVLPILGPILSIIAIVAKRFENKKAAVVILIADNILVLLGLFGAGRFAVYTNAEKLILAPILVISIIVLFFVVKEVVAGYILKPFLPTQRKSAGQKSLQNIFCIASLALFAMALFMPMYKGLNVYDSESFLEYIAQGHVWLYIITGIVMATINIAYVNIAEIAGVITSVLSGMIMILVIYSAHQEVSGGISYGGYSTRTMGTGYILMIVSVICMAISIVFHFIRLSDNVAR